jgi:hypothetical protein
MDGLSCIYIPRISTLVPSEVIASELENRGIGRISRIDFAPITKHPGFGKDVDLVVRSAFVHFKDSFVNELTEEIVKKFKNSEAYRFYPEFCPPPYFKREYWLLLKAANPIPETTMTNAQIVNNCHLLEVRVEEQAQTIRQLQDALERVYQDTAGRIAVLEATIRGLIPQPYSYPSSFCENQEGELHRYARVTPDLSGCEQYVDNYESDLDDYDTDDANYNACEDATILTRDSMPALEKMSIGSERSNISSDLCGNE